MNYAKLLFSAPVFAIYFFMLLYLTLNITCSRQNKKTLIF